jgi:hypothetical protein
VLRFHEKETTLGNWPGGPGAAPGSHPPVQELNEVRGKASELARANQEAARRIDSAMARIRGVLGS